MHEESFDSHRFLRYLAENGPERMAGYLDAVQDMVARIEPILDIPCGAGSIPNTPSGVRTELRAFHRQQKALAQNLTQLLSEGVPPPAPASDDSTRLTP